MFGTTFRSSSYDYSSMYQPVIHITKHHCIQLHIIHFQNEHKTTEKWNWEARMKCVLENPRSHKNKNLPTRGNPVPDLTNRHKIIQCMISADGPAEMLVPPCMLRSHKWNLLCELFHVTSHTIHQLSRILPILIVTTNCTQILFT